MAAQRLDKIIASTGRWSRREVKELVKAGLKYIRIVCRLLPEEDLVRELDPIMSHVMATGSENKNKFRLTVDVER